MELVFWIVGLLLISLFCLYIGIVNFHRVTNEVMRAFEDEDARLLDS